MALEQRLNLKLAQKLVMTPTLQQAIKLLQLSRLELEQAMSQEVQVNPLLELSEDEQRSEDASTSEALASDSGEPSEASAVEEQAEGVEDSFSQINVEELFGNFLHDAPFQGTAGWDEDERSPLENSPAPPASLFDSLAEQLRFLGADDSTRKVAEFIAGNLDPDGFLRVSLDDLAASLDVPLADAERALELVQSLEPAGIGARSLQECFRLQLARKLETAATAQPAITQALKVLDYCFDDLLHQRWERITRQLGLSLEDVRKVIEVLKHLDLRPGLQLGQADNVVIEPDVVVTKVEGEWRVALADDGFPRLRLSSRYVRMLRARSVDSEAASYLRERMRAALWFLRSVEQRQNTILRVARAIVQRQSGFLDHGLPHLRPLVLRDIADDIGMHESTISRVVTNKHMATPRGVFPFKFFFHSAISHAVEGDISSVVVRDRIKELIATEDPRRPLSDARVARQLNRLGIRIARRTVAKYREEMGIPSSEQRRRALR